MKKHTSYVVQVHLPIISIAFEVHFQLTQKVKIKNVQRDMLGIGLKRPINR